MSRIQGDRRTFYQLLVSTLLVSVINFTVWFAITFYVYLQTRSVFATGVISGIFLVMTALTGIWFGSLVDHHAKKTMMQVSAVVSFLLYAAAAAIYQVTPHGSFTDPTSVALWALVVLLMFGVIAGNIRTIALPTLVTVLITEDTRDRANGLIGTTSGVSFLVTSVISGVLVAIGGMFWVLALALVVLAVAVVHLALVPVPERPTAPDPAVVDRSVDLRGTIRVVSEVPGLMALIFFSAFNNLLGGVFMALMDAYGLSLMSVQVWGLLWGILSTGFILVAVLDRPPHRRPVRVHAARAVRGGRRTDGPAEGGALRAAGPGLRFRAERRAGRLAADRVPDLADRPVRVHPVHDRRGRGPDDRPLVRHRRRPRPGARVHADRRRPGRDGTGAAQSPVPAAERPLPAGSGQQASPRHACRPSLTATAAITSAATGSAHQPSTALATSPASSTTDR
jgi:MFS family permease